MAARGIATPRVVRGRRSSGPWEAFAALERREVVGKVVIAMGEDIESTTPTADPGGGGGGEVGSDAGERGGGGGKGKTFVKGDVLDGVDESRPFGARQERGTHPLGTAVDATSLDLGVDGPFFAET